MHRGYQGVHNWRWMVWAYCAFLGLPKSPPPAIDRIRERTQIMGVSTTILFGRERPTAATWGFIKQTGQGKCKGKEEGRRGSGDNGKNTREGGRQTGWEGGRRKGREERMVVYSKDDAASNPPWGPPHSSRGTLRRGPNIISNNSSFRQKHPGVPDASDGSDGTSYPLMEDYMLPVAPATGCVAQHQQNVF